jgi:hypothetical protein
MSIKDDLASLCALEAKIAALTAQKDDLRRRLLSHALDTLESDGVAPTYRHPMGSVILTVPEPKPSVYDEDAFAAYVAEAYGDGAVETVQRVKPNVRDAILPTFREADESAGVTMKERMPYLTVRLSKDAKAAAAAELENEETAA